jgi:2-aminoadipate transaminase
VPKNPAIDALHREAAERRDVIGLAGGLPASELLPKEAMAEALAAAAQTDDALQYGWPEGAARLRGWIAGRLGARGLAVDPDAVIVTAGAQQALSLIAAFLPSGSTIGVGDATYPAAIAAFEAAGLEPTATRDAAAHYLVTGVSNPRGVAIDSTAALASGRPVIADEAYAELRFDGEVPAPLAADAADRVWHVGTASKVLSPGLRVGWLIPPAHAREAILQSKEAADLQTGSLAQAALVRLLDGLDYDETVARARRFYAERAGILVEALERHLPDARFTAPEGGFSVWVELEEPGDDVALLEAAVAQGVSFDPGSMFRPPADRARAPLAFRLSFSASGPEDLVEGSRRLARVLDRRRPGVRIPA